MTWDDARKLMQQKGVFTARKSWVGTGFGCVYYDANEKMFRTVRQKMFRIDLEDAPLNPYQYGYDYFPFFGIHPYDLDGYDWYVVDDPKKNKETFRLWNREIDTLKVNHQSFFKDNADKIESYRSGDIYKKYYAPCDVKEE
jgi:hypothetical protein